METLLREVQDDPHLHKRPDTNFAMKKNAGQRVTFTLEQKEVMIEFNNRQAESGIRADPKSVIEAMKNRNVEPLKEVQIKRRKRNRKRKTALQNMAEQAQQGTTQIDC